MTQIMSAAPGTYIDRLMIDHDSTVERWSDHVKHPLKVWIDSSESPHGAQAGFPAAVRHAFATWAATGIPLHVAFVASARDADVRVHWTGHLKGKTGSTTWRTDRNGWLSGGDITLATHVGDGTALDARGMRAIALHEVGHALGLAHSTNPRDVMAPLVHVDTLSRADRNTIVLLYSLPAGHAVTGNWNSVVTVSGQNVTVRNASYNGALSPNGSTTFGFQVRRPNGNTQLAAGYTCASP